MVKTNVKASSRRAARKNVKVPLSCQSPNNKFLPDELGHEGRITKNMPYFEITRQGSLIMYMRNRKGDLYSAMVSQNAHEDWAELIKEDGPFAGSFDDDQFFALADGCIEWQNLEWFKED